MAAKCQKRKSRMGCLRPKTPEHLPGVFIERGVDNQAAAGVAGDSVQAIQNGFHASIFERKRVTPISLRARSLRAVNSSREVAPLSQVVKRWVCLLNLVMTPSPTRNFMFANYAVP